jgi:hypothetical protein
MFDAITINKYAKKIQQYSSKLNRGLEFEKIAKYTAKLRNLVQMAAEATLLQSKQAKENKIIINGNLLIDFYFNF